MVLVGVGKSFPAEEVALDQRVGVDIAQRPAGYPAGGPHAQRMHQGVGAGSPRLVIEPGRFR